MKQEMYLRDAARREAADSNNESRLSWFPSAFACDLVIPNVWPTCWGVKLGGGGNSTACPR